MRTAHLCCGLGGSLWTGAILGWTPVYALDFDSWRTDRLAAQRDAGWWNSGLRIECADLTGWTPPALDGELDLLAAGFSCKDISTAGKGEGLGGKSTGPTYTGCLRAIDAWKPRRILFENSPAIRTKGRTQVTADLVARGYRWRDGIISAADVGAPHKRDRWYLLATNADSQGLEGASEREIPIFQPCESLERKAVAASIEASSDASFLRRQRVGQRSEEMGGEAGEDDNSARGEGEDGDAAPGVFADLNGPGFPDEWYAGRIPDESREAIQAAERYTGSRTWNPPHPDLCRVVDGLAAGLDRGRRISALGDAWVPLQAAAAYKILSGETVSGKGEEGK